MKKCFFVVFCSLFFVLLNGCVKSDYPSPYIAFIEVLDSEGSIPLTECEFSATYDGQNIENLNVRYHEMSDEEFKEACDGSDHYAAFINGKTSYEIGSDLYSTLMASGLSVSEILSKSEFSVSRENYKTLTFTLTVDDVNSNVVRHSLLLEKAE